MSPLSQAEKHEYLDSLWDALRARCGSKQMPWLLWDGGGPGGSGAVYYQRDPESEVEVWCSPATAQNLGGEDFPADDVCALEFCWSDAWGNWEIEERVPFPLSYDLQKDIALWSDLVCSFRAAKGDDKAA
jgi:hypothetical protein